MGPIVDQPEEHDFAARHSLLGGARASAANARGAENHAAQLAAIELRRVTQVVGLFGDRMSISRLCRYLNPTDDRISRALPRAASLSWSPPQRSRYGFRYSPLGE